MAKHPVLWMGKSNFNRDQGGLMASNGQISFHKSGQRPAARYVSAETVYEEALEHGRLIGLYWSAAGQVQRENTTAGLPGLDSRHRPLHAFELEIDGQALHNRWDWVGGTERPGERPGPRPASRRRGRRTAAPSAPGRNRRRGRRRRSTRGAGRRGA